MSEKLRTLLIVSTEPAPYKIDMYNALSDLGGWNVFVFYAATKDWSIDAGHDFQNFPLSRFRYRKNKGKGLLGQVISAVKVMFLVLRDYPSLIVVCGYNGLPYVMSMITAYFVKVPFFMWVDQFNVSAPRKKGDFVLFVRDALRNFVFRKSAAILVCGRPGLNSAVRSGCPENKVVDFPYVVDKKSIENFAKSIHDLHDLALPDAMRPIILFSGRFIPRKGLQTLLRAIAKIRNEVGEFLLIVEGDGPLRNQYEEMVRDLELNTNVLFVGFRQMDEHAYLLSKSDIVVVPSLRDPWGICCTGARIIKDGSIPVTHRPDPSLNGHVFYQYLSNKITSFMTPTVMIRKICVDRVGLFDERLWRGEDAEFFLRIFKLYKLAVLPDILATVHLQTTKSLDSRFESSRLIILEKHEAEIRDELGWYAAKRFRGNTFWLIAEAKFRERKLGSGMKYFMHALASFPLLSPERYARIFLAASGLTNPLKRAVRALKGAPH